MNFTPTRARHAILRLLAAGALVLLVLWLVGPPGDRGVAVRAIWVVPRGWLFFIGGVCLTAFVLEGASHVIAVAKRGQRSISGAGVACFALGLLSALCALTLWLALFGLVTALPGLLFGWFALRAERKRGAGHSLLNLAGLALNAADVLLVISQVITATIWR